MGWSDNVDNRIEKLAEKVDWLLGHHARLLIGRRVKVPYSRVWVGDRREWVEGPGTVTGCAGGTMDVRLDSGQMVEVEVHEAEVLNEEVESG